jgi:hypothetical protein
MKKIPRPTKKRIAKFLARTAIRSKDECWNWIGNKSPDGYGFVFLDGKSILAHRFSWRVYIGKIPKNLCVCHHCDNPSCVNPKHLFLGTIADNNHDMCKKGRCITPEPKKKLTEELVIKIRSLRVMRLFGPKKISKVVGLPAVLCRNALRKDRWTHIPRMIKHEFN